MEITPADNLGTWIEVDVWTGRPVTEIVPVDNLGTWIEITFADPGGWSLGSLAFGGGSGWH